MPVSLPGLLLRPWGLSGLVVIRVPGGCVATSLPSTGAQGNVQSGPAREATPTFGSGAFGEDAPPEAGDAAIRLNRRGKAPRVNTPWPGAAIGG